MSLFETTEICFGFTKNGNFYQEKAFIAGKNATEGPPQQAADKRVGN